ncbi:MAG: DUF5317 domain-containing protein [Caldicoprobacterales bacterium]|jgi:hypothetical protein|nr:DUF5317 domain-containing protein [Clostridiales bacterium]
MFYCTLAAAVLLGFLRGGRFSNLTKVRLVHPWLAFLSVAMDAGLILLIKSDFPVTRLMAFLSLSLQYTLLFLFIWFNRHLPFSWVIALGCFLNALVILLNKGSMPLAEIGPYVGKSEFANEYLLSGKLPVYHIINENTLLWFLGDVIWVPFFRIFISIGDIILYGGTFLLVQHLIADKKYSKKQPE